jgi:hypothetical protein
MARGSMKIMLLALFSLLSAVVLAGTSGPYPG